jgi:dolichol-phosphate mannosyltransferase
VIYVVLPAFNEARTIERTVRRIAELARADPSYQIVLVDDGSSDRTDQLAAGAAGDAIQLTVLRHPENQGLGAAIRTGLYWVLDRAADSDVIAMLDADDTHPPELLPSMVALVRDGNDVVIASRYQAGAVVEGVPANRRLISALGRSVFRLAFPMEGVRDYTCGYRCYGVPALRRARVVYGDDLVTQRGFEATVDLLLRLRQVGIRAAEVPLLLDYSGRVGESKMRVWRTIRSTLWLLARRVVDRFTRFSPGRVRSIIAAGQQREAG